MDFKELISKKTKESEVKFQKEVEEKMKNFNLDGYKLLKEYEESLLKYWRDGHGEFIVLISEMQGFLDCLTRQKLVEEENYMYIVDCFKEKLKEMRRRV